MPEPQIAEIPAAPVTGEVIGRLRTTAGAALPGGVVTVTAPSGRQVGRVLAGAEGGYSVTGLPSGTYTVIVTATGFRPEAVTVSVDGFGAVHDFVLAGGGAGRSRHPDPAGRLYGTVAGPDGQGLAYATVTISDAGGKVAGTTVTDPDGGYELSGLPPGEYTVDTRLYEPAVQRVKLTVGDQPAVDLHLASTSHEPAEIPYVKIAE